jgi:excisionase family DNA binding protein
MDEYLTIPEVAALLKVKPKTIRNKMAAGVFREGVHFFRPPGLGPRFKSSAVVAWLEQSRKVASVESADGIPMARGYVLRTGT